MRDYCWLCHGSCEQRKAKSESGPPIRVYECWFSVSVREDAKVVVIAESFAEAEAKYEARYGAGTFTPAKLQMIRELSNEPIL